MKTQIRREILSPQHHHSPPLKFSKGSLITCSTLGPKQLHLIDSNRTPKTKSWSSYFADEETQAQGAPIAAHSQQTPTQMALLSHSCLLG